MSKKPNNFDNLKLSNQLCFPLYATSKEIIKKYRPHLDKIDLTYTQYLVMLVMWENSNINIKELGDKLFLDSGTLTPVLKKLESKKLITKSRSKDDERIIFIRLTEDGYNLREEVARIQIEVSTCVNLNQEEAKLLYDLLYKMLKTN